MKSKSSLKNESMLATKELVEAAESASIWVFFRALVATFHTGINPEDIDQILAAIDKRIQHDSDR